MTPHGTYSRYRNDGCRCIPCTDANNAESWRYRSLRGQLGVHGPRAPRHGTRYEYVHHGCRCEACRAAEAAYRKSYRGRK